MNTLKTALVLIGTTIGAGFITGAELLRFFQEGYLGALFLSCLLYFFVCVFFLRLGRKYGGYEGALRALFRSAAPAAKAAVLCAAFVPCAGMLAGLDALLPSVRPFASLGGLLVVLLFLSRGTKGIAVLNSALVPLLLMFVFWYGRGKFALSLPPDAAGAWNAVLYAGMNIVFALPVLCDLGTHVRRPAISAGSACSAIFICAVVILSAIRRAGDGALGAEMPFLYAAHGNKIFYGAVACAILTSLASSLYPLLSACERVRGAKKYAAEAGILLAAFAVSRLGLSGVVHMFYPVIGGAGVLFSAFCVFDEYFLQKNDKKIHTRGKHAEDKRRAHHKIEFKHLTAVDDKVSESRTRDDIFAHDGSDPRHSHVDFQHGDDGGIGGGQNEFP